MFKFKKENNRLLKSVIIFSLLFVLASLVTPLSVSASCISYQNPTQQGTELPDGTCEAGFYQNNLKCDGTGIGCFIVGMNDLLNVIFPFIIGLAVFVIVVQIFIYIAQGENEEKRKEAVRFITFGVFAVFIMLSIWGLVALLVNTFNLDQSARLTSGYVEPTDRSDADKAGIVGLMDNINYLISRITPFLIGLAVFFIIFQIFVYVTQGSNEEKRKEAAKFIAFGVISVFLMLSIWGLVNILASTITFDDNSIPVDKIPKIKLE